MKYAPSSILAIGAMIAAIMGHADAAACVAVIAAFALPSNH